MRLWGAVSGVAGFSEGRFDYACGRILGQLVVFLKGDSRESRISDFLAERVGFELEALAAASEPRAEILSEAEGPSL